MKPRIRYCARVQRLGVGLFFERARFEQQHFDIGAEKLQRHADTRGARTDNADISPECMLRGEGVRIENHDSFADSRASQGLKQCLRH